MGFSYQYILTNTAGTPKTLTRNPDGSKAFTREYRRHKDYHSVFYTESSPLTFINRGINDDCGYQFILAEWEIYGAKSFIQVERKKKNLYTGDFDNDFIGFIDFSPSAGFKVDLTEMTIECILVDNEKVTRFLRRNDIEYDLSSTVSSDGVTVTSFSSSPLDIDFLPIDLYRNATFDISFNDFGDKADAPKSFGGIGDLTLNEIGDDASYVEESPATVKFYENSSGYDLTLNLKAISIDCDASVIFTPSVLGDNAGVVRFSASIAVFNSIGTQVFSKQIGSIYEIEVIEITSATTINESFTLADSSIGSVAIQDGYFAGIVLQIVEVLDDNMTSTEWVYGGSADEYNYSTQLIGEPTTQVAGYKAFELCTRLFQLMTSETDTNKIFDSIVLGRTDSEFKTYPSLGDWANLFYTNGYKTRGFPDTGTTAKPINYSFKDTFKNLDSIIGATVIHDRANDIFKIEKIEDAYDNTLVYDHGIVSDVVIEFSDGYHNEIKAGYPKVNPEKFQGVNEFNVPVAYGVSILEKKKLDKTSKVHASSVLIELTRREQYKSTASEDTKNDETNFVVWTDGSETIQGGTNVSGFDGVDDYYNLNISPRENLLRQSQIKPNLFGSAEDIAFVKSEKNLNFTYQNQNSDTVNEQDDIAQSELINTFVKNRYISFNNIVPVDLIDAIEANPNGYHRIETESGDEYFGFIEDFKIPDFENKGTFKMIEKA